jgi:hypothetical protein
VALKLGLALLLAPLFALLLAQQQDPPPLVLLLMTASTFLAVLWVRQWVWGLGGLEAPGASRRKTSEMQTEAMRH